MNSYQPVVISHDSSKVNKGFVTNPPCTSLRKSSDCSDGWGWRNTAGSRRLGWPWKNVSPRLYSGARRKLLENSRCVSRRNTYWQRTARQADGRSDFLHNGAKWLFGDSRGLLALFHPWKSANFLY